MPVSRQYLYATGANVSFAYNKDAVRFDVHLSQEHEVVAIAGNKNSMMALAESCSFYATLDPKGKHEHDHWHTTDGSDAVELVTSLDNSFTGGHSMIYDEDDDEDVALIINRPTILIEFPDPIDANIVLHPQATGRIDILADNNGMAVMANALLRLLQFEDITEVYLIAEADQAEWGFCLIRFVLQEPTK